MNRILALVVALWCACAPAAEPSRLALQYRATLTREAQFVYGLRAPIPMFAAQIHQESGWRSDVTAWDNGRGLGQFMDATALQVSRNFPELGAPSPYDPRWSIRALVRYDGWLRARANFDTECESWAGALTGYNGGIGYVLQSQRASLQPGVWWNVTERVPTRQSPKNFEYSRLYPRWILFKHLSRYREWGTNPCEGVTP